MLDIRWIRDNREALDRALTNRGERPAAKRLIDLDDRRRAVIAKAQDVQTKRNAASKEIGGAKAAGEEDRAAALIAEVATLKEESQRLVDEERDAVKALEEALAEIPNVPLDEVPVGPDETANREIRHWPEQREGDTPPPVDWAKEHFELGEALGQMDFATAAKLSGSRFVVLKGGLARLERALGQFMLDLHVTEHGYTEVQPPLLVRDRTAFGTGQLPKFEEDLFHVTTTLRETILKIDAEHDRVSSLLRRENKALSKYEAQARASRLEASTPAATTIIGQAMEPARRVEFAKEQIAKFEIVRDELLATRTSLIERAAGLTSKLYLIPTAEVPLTNLVRESILAEDELPLRFTALTPCFRSEAGSAGKDTRGMLRQHQFDKVELVSITTPEESAAEHERMTECAETVLKKLGLAFRTMVLSTGDMGFGARKTYDIEVWLPGQEQYREISSCSACGDFQARRMNARYRPDDGKGTQFVHTLNGSGVAVGRALIAVMETFQNPDGSIAVPDALHPYMGGMEKVQ